MRSSKVPGALKVGSPEESSGGSGDFHVNHTAILGEIAKGKDGAKLVAGDRPSISTVVVHPADGVRRRRPWLRLRQHEIFGPVLSVIRPRDFDRRSRSANGTEFGLTGGLYCAIAPASRALVLCFHVGNLYINREDHGSPGGSAAILAVSNTSGSNSKAGGPDYLRLFAGDEVRRRALGRPLTPRSGEEAQSGTGYRPSQRLSWKGPGSLRRSPQGFRCPENKTSAPHRDGRARRRASHGGATTSVVSIWYAHDFVKAVGSRVAASATSHGMSRRPLGHSRFSHLARAHNICSPKTLFRTTTPRSGSTA